LAGEQATRPKLESTEKALPDTVYWEQPMPSMQKVWLAQSIENELESKSKAQPVFELAARTKWSVLPFTTQLSLALLQMGQAYCGAVLALPAAEVPASPVTAPPQAAMPALTSDSPIEISPKLHRTTH
jgi:hypothetical protein